MKLKIEFQLPNAGNRAVAATAAAVTRQKATFMLRFVECPPLAWHVPRDGSVV